MRFNSVFILRPCYILATGFENLLHATMPIITETAIATGIQTRLLLGFIYSYINQVLIVHNLLQLVLANQCHLQVDRVPQRQRA